MGRAGLGAEILVADDEGRELPRGEVGEIVVRGPMVTQRLLAAARGHGRRRLRDGWFHTGDGGRMDADGYLFIADRLKDMIITGGENVYRAEVEAALRSHPAVARCRGDRRARRALGRGGARGRGAAARTRRQRRPALRDELRAWCRERLAGYKCPRSIAFVDALPLSAAGKVLKNAAARAAHRAMKPMTAIADPRNVFAARALHAAAGRAARVLRRRPRPPRLDARPELENVDRRRARRRRRDAARRGHGQRRRVAASTSRRTAVTLNLDTSFLAARPRPLTADGEVLAVDDGVALVPRHASSTMRGRLVARAMAPSATCRIR